MVNVKNVYVWIFNFLNWYKNILFKKLVFINKEYYKKNLRYFRIKNGKEKIKYKKV